MTTYNPGTGFTGTPDPVTWARGQAAIADARSAAGGATLDIFASADFIFVDPLVGEPRLVEAFEDLASVVRASKAWVSDWGGVNGAPAGSLIEVATDEPAWAASGLQVMPSIENLIENPRGEGSALPATPTGWVVDAPGGTLTFTGRGAENGWPYVEITVDGTLSGLGYISPSGEIAAAAGDNVTAAIGIALVSGSIPDALSLVISKDSGSTQGSLEMAATAIHTRWSLSVAMTATTTFALQRVWLPAGVYDNAVIRLYAPQMTMTAWPTSVVLPPAGTPAATVRAADDIGIDPAGWYRHDAGTLVVEFDTPRVFGRSIVSLAVNGLYGRSIITLGSAAFFQAAIEAGGGANQDGPTLTAGRHLAAMSWSGRDHYASVDGVSVTPWSTTSDVLPPDELNLGRGGTNDGAQGAQRIHRVRFIPLTLTGAALDLLTTPWWED